MGNIGKSLALVLIIIMAISSLTLMLVKPASAQTIPSPAVPEFTLKLVQHILNFPPTSSIDPFTGKQTVNAGSQLEWTTIDITIINQNFNGKTEFGDNTYTGMMYDVEFKGHFVNDWTQLGPINGEGAAGPYFIQKSGSATVVSLALNEADINTITIYALDSRPDSIVTVPEGGQADIRIQAMAGNAYTSRVIPFDSWHFNGTESEWSNVQTITFNEADATTVIVKPSEQTPTPTLTATTSPTPTPTPTVPEFPTLIILPLFAVATLLSFVFIRKRIAKNATKYLSNYVIMFTLDFEL